MIRAAWLAPAGTAGTAPWALRASSASLARQPIARVNIFGVDGRHLTKFIFGVDGTAIFFTLFRHGTAAFKFCLLHCLAVANSLISTLRERHRRTERQQIQSLCKTSASSQSMKLEPVVSGAPAPVLITGQ